MNTKTTKKALITSIISMLVCFTMLIGTTFAWFTDSVTNDNNVIKTGTLNVGFYWSNAYDNVKNTAIDRTNANWNDAGTSGAIFNNDLWEPGYAEARHIKITNEGTLALRYSLAIIPHGEVSILADVIDVYVVDDATTTIGNRDNIDQKYYVGNLRTFIANGGTEVKVDENTAGNKETTATKNPTITSGKLTAEGTEGDTYTATIVLKMREEAGNEYQNLSIGSDFSIQLMATQVTAEQDSFDDQYDVNAYYVVNNSKDLRDAINEAVDTTTIYLQAGPYDVSGVITLSDKEVTLVGLGVVKFVNQKSSDHIFCVRDNSVVTFKNLNLDGNGSQKNGIYVRNNSTATLENCTVKNTNGVDIMIDEGFDAEHGFNTKSVVQLRSTSVEDVAMCASPVSTVKATQDTYAYFCFDENSSVIDVEIQPVNIKPENCVIVMGDYIADPSNCVMDYGTTNGYVFYANNDATLARALNMIDTNAKYWNVPVTVKLAAGEYSGNYTINQYPEWNGVEGAGDTKNNYATGVPAGAPALDLTFVGTTAVAGRAVATKPAAVFVGKVNVKGFGNSNTSYDNANSTITFNNVAFDGEKLLADEKGNVVVFTANAAANNLSFNNCYFANATHVSFGGANPNGVKNVSFDECYFNDGGCISGSIDGLTVTDTTVVAASNGFINNSRSGAITVDNCTVNAGKYFLRTDNSGVNVNVTNTAITLYRAGDAGKETDYLVYFRGSNESLTFTDCTLPANYTTKGVDADSTLEAYDFYDVSGVTYFEDEISGEVTLYVVSDDAPEPLTIPEGVTTIGGWSFSGSNVKTVIMPSTVTRIAKKAFDGSAVENVVLNEGLTEIETQAFSKANNLKEINFPSTLTTVGSEAFRLTAIETLTIPANVTNIDTGAFRDMPNLTTVIIEGDAVIANFAFRSCANLTTVKLLGTNVTFTGTSMAFSLADNAGNMSQITFYVDNQVIADRLAKAQGSAKGYNLVIKNPTNENGVIVDGAGNALAYDNEYLNNAISNGFDVIKLSSGEYIIPDSAANKNLTIVGNGDTTVAVQFDGSYEGCDYSLRGSTVVFENIVITTPNNNYAGWAGLKATFNNCTINGTYTLYDNTTFNNCTFNVSGDSYNIWTWGAPNATFNNCIFNTSGKAILFYGNVNSILTVNNCVFNDDNKFADVNNKAAIEVGSDWAADTKTIIATNCTVNGFDVTNKGICTGTTLFGNKNSLTGNRLSVTVDDMTYVCVSNAEELTAAIKAANDGDEILVAPGTYNLRFTNDTNFNVDDLTITGVGNVTVNVTSSEAWYGRIQGSNVTFENIHFTSSVGATGKATYNNCTFDDWTICASSNNEETTFNNCTINGCLNTSTDFSSGDVFVNNCKIAKAEYSGSMTMNFVNCQIGEIIIWNADTNLTNCQVTTLDTSHVTNATVTIK